MKNDTANRLAIGDDVPAGPSRRVRPCASGSPDELALDVPPLCPGELEGRLFWCGKAGGPAPPYAQPGMLSELECRYAIWNLHSRACLARTLPAGLSLISRLCGVWAVEPARFRQRQLRFHQYAYWFVDGVHVSVRLGEDELVVIGVREDGTKESRARHRRPRAWSHARSSCCTRSWRRRRAATRSLRLNGSATSSTRSTRKRSPSSTVTGST